MATWQRMREGEMFELIANIYRAGGESLRMSGVLVKFYSLKLNLSIRILNAQLTSKLAK